MKLQQKNQFIAIKLLEVRQIVIEMNTMPEMLVKISKTLLKCFKTKFWKTHIKIFHNNICIFQQDTARGMEKFFQYYKYDDFPGGQFDIKK